MSSGPEGQRVVRQLRHDVDDVFELLTEQSERLSGIEGGLAGVDGRLGGVERRLEGIENTQQQVLELLRELRGQ